MDGMEEQFFSLTADLSAKGRPKNGIVAFIESVSIHSNNQGQVIQN